MSKLPEDIKLHISPSMSISREWDVDELLAALLKEIESREICSFMNYSRKDKLNTEDPVNMIILQAQLFSVAVINLDNRLQLNVLTVEKITKVTNVI